MFDRIRSAFDDVLAARQRRADIELLDGLSDRALADLGVERCDIERLVDRSRRKPRYEARPELVYEGWFSPCG